MKPELEAKIRKRLEWQESKLHDQKREFGNASMAYQRTEAYISALKWVLEISKVARQEELR